MFKPRISIDRELYARLTKAAVAGGYSSTEEFVLHVLERTVASLETEESEEAIRRRLKGLGYLE